MYTGSVFIYAVSSESGPSLVRVLTPAGDAYNANFGFNVAPVNADGHLAVAAK